MGPTTSNAHTAGIALAAGSTPHAHSTMQLLPEWVGVAGSIMFVIIAISHLRYLRVTEGQRRPWHACHVLTAAGMAFMYAPAAIDPVRVPGVLWQLVFASAGALAALWALGGGLRVPTVMWLLTSIDLGAMTFMWSAHAPSAPLDGLLAAYFTVQAGMWSVDAYRRLDGRTPIISWSLMSNASGQAVLSGRAVRTVASDSLIGGVEIGVSMIAMTLGMGYMVAVMSLH